MTTKFSFLETLAGKMTPNVPFWFMRQAGRYLPEYRELRAKSGGFLNMVYNPPVACEITMQPIRRFGMNAAIIFSDILVVPQALGQKLEFMEGEGPKLDSIQNPSDISKLGFTRFDQVLSPVYESLTRTKTALNAGGFSDTALIGFCGAPWTLAAYMIEGGGSKDFARAKNFAKAHPNDFAALLDMLVEGSILYLSKQIEAGAQAVQIFDSHAGILDAEEFKNWVIAPTKKIASALRQKFPDVPVIGFPRGAKSNYEAYAKNAGVTALGLDQFENTKSAAKTLQPILPVQGNLDPEILVKGGEALKSEAVRILDDLSAKPFIFNLGHGVIKETPPEHMEQLVKVVREYKRK